MGTGNSAVSQPQVPQVRVRFRNSGPVAVPQPVTAVSRVFAVLSVHCQPKSRSVISSYTYQGSILEYSFCSIYNTRFNTNQILTLSFLGPLTYFNSLLTVFNSLPPAGY